MPIYHFRTIYRGRHRQQASLCCTTRPGLSKSKGAGGGDNVPTRFWQSRYPYFRQEGQIIPPTLILATPPNFQTFLRPCRLLPVSCEFPVNFFLPSIALLSNGSICSHFSCNVGEACLQQCLQFPIIRSTYNEWQLGILGSI